MKKLIALAAAGVLAAALCLTGCSSSASSEPAPAPEPTGDAPAYTLVTEGTLTVGTSPDYPPFENLEGDEIIGYEVDLVNAIAAELGLEVVYIPMNFDAIISAVDAGTQIDMGMSGFSKLPEREKIIDFTDTFFIDNLAIATKTDGEFTTEESLNTPGIKIAVQSGTTGESQMKEDYPDAEVKSYTGSNDCFAALEAGQVDAVCTNDAVVASMIAGSYSDAAIVKTIATGEEYGLVLSKENAQLTADINAVLAKFAEDGTLDSMMKKWF